MSLDFYKAFEDKFRGSRELIKSRLEGYLPFILPLKALYSEIGVIDLGCGRGEWLELLQTQGIPALGIDLDPGMLAVCHERKLKVQTGDAVQFLQSLPDQSQGLVTAFHIVEHLAFKDLQTLVAEALRVLRPAGLLIMETPNPENFAVAGNSFYLDPTHQRPLPSQLLAFLPEYYGFARNKIIGLQESPDLLNKQDLTTLDLLTGVSPDYAVIAQKAAEKTVIERFDEPFSLQMGISLDHLSQLHTQQHSSWRTELEHRTQQSEFMTAQIAKETELQSNELKSSISHAAKQTELMTSELKSTLAKSEFRVDELQSSISHAAKQTELMTSELKSTLAKNAEQNEFKVDELQSSIGHATKQAELMSKELKSALAKNAEQTEFRADELKFSISHITKQTELIADELKSAFAKNAEQTEYKADELRSSVGHLAKQTTLMVNGLQSITQQFENQTKDREDLISLSKSLDEAKTLNFELNSLLHQKSDELGKNHTYLERLQAHTDWLQSINQELTRKIQETEWSLQQAESRLNNLLGSKAWRLSAPLRWVSNLAEKIRSKITDLPSRFKPYLKTLLIHTILFIRRHPRLKHSLLGIIKRIPKLRVKVNNLIIRLRPHYAPLKTSFSAPVVVSIDTLNHRAKKIYNQLLAENENNKSENCQKDF